MTAFLRARAIPGVETVTADGRYLRSIALDETAGTIEVRRSEGRDARTLEATISLADDSRLPEVVERLKVMFDLAADVRAIEAHLSQDALLRPIVARRPGLRVPGTWSGYELAVRAILGQQITVAGATTLASRLVKRFGDGITPDGGDTVPGITHLFPSPERLADADVAAIGMPRARALAIQTVARAALQTPQLFEPAVDRAGSISALRALPGIGEWTAQYIAMRALRDPDAFPAGDIGLIRALAGTGGVRPSEREVARLAEPWRPWRAYAAVHLWANDAPPDS